MYLKKSQELRTEEYRLFDLTSSLLGCRRIRPYVTCKVHWGTQVQDIKRLMQSWCSHVTCGCLCPMCAVAFLGGRLLIDCKDARCRMFVALYYTIWYDNVWYICMQLCISIWLAGVTLMGTMPKTCPRQSRNTFNVLLFPWGMVRV